MLRLLLRGLLKKSTNIANQRGKIFGKYLLITNTFSAGLFLSAGDFVQQHIKRKQSIGYDWRRNKHMFISGFCQGPLLHVIYKVLDKALPGELLRTVVTKVCIDVGLISPICIIHFFLTMNYLNGENLTASMQEIRKKFLTVYAVDCVVWTPCQLINFRYVCSKHRVVYVNVVSMCYSVFLSYIKHVDHVG